MQYHVRFVEDSRLPGGVDFAFASVGDETFLFMKQSACEGSMGECEALTRSFNTWQQAQNVRPRDLVAI